MNPQNWFIGRTDAEVTWAKFRLEHPELYTVEHKMSVYWPFVIPVGGVR